MQLTEAVTPKRPRQSSTCSCRNYLFASWIIEEKECADVCALAQISYCFNQTKSAIVWRHTVVQIMPCIAIMEQIPTPNGCTIVANSNRDIYPSVVCVVCARNAHIKLI